MQLTSPAALGPHIARVHVPARESPGASSSGFCLVGQEKGVGRTSSVALSPPSHVYMFPLAKAPEFSPAASASLTGKRVLDAPLRWPWVLASHVYMFPLAKASELPPAGFASDAGDLVRRVRLQVL
eukprot:CAMPEP_0172607238 /NCGR_PEP_ID=MMETSP1068-20121228/27447_1 /TAXON_ID=35684 /ORGANISM="Pseudopedinella elastica, Strain CCMP716" /LENGTH=125 /DNA_ID=CAMNT_0013410185 /DNA_START=592 /DNA_END=970 /DNA_ORIENTATION=-